MKEKILLSLISLIMILTTGAIFQYGEKIINEDATWGYSIFHFTSKENVVDKEKKITKLLAITINNLEGKATAYEISFFVNDQKTGELKQEITAGESKNITPPEEILSPFEYSEQTSTLNYLVKIKWNDKEETLTKKIILTNEK